VYVVFTGLYITEYKFNDMNEANTVILTVQLVSIITSWLGRVSILPVISGTGRVESQKMDPSAGKAKAGMVHSVRGCMRGVQVKL